MQEVNLDEHLIISYSNKADGNMDERYSDRSVTMQNRRKILNHYSLNPKLVVEGKQIHSDRVLYLDEENTKMWYGCNIPGVDGFITSVKDVGLLLKVADCVPVVLFDTKHQVLGITHNGWKGTLKNIHLKALTIMANRHETKPEDVKVWLGPSAKSCCYISKDQPEQVNDPNWMEFITPKNDAWSVNLEGYIKKTLLSAGVLEENILIDPVCTVESADFFSHTRSSSSDTESEGRFLVLAKIR